MKSFVNKIAENKKWDARLYALAILVPVLTASLSYPFGMQKHSGAIFLPTIAAVIFSVAIVLQILEARKIRYWTALAGKIKSGADGQIVLRSWQKIYLPFFVIMMGLFPYVTQMPDNDHIRWYAWIFVFWGAWYFLARSRWSPIGIPEIEVTKDYIRIPNPTALQVGGKKEYRRSYLLGVLYVPLDQVKSIYWTVMGRSANLVVKCSGLTVEHPFLKKPPQTILDQECLIAASILGGSIPPDAIISFVERIAPNYEGK